MSTWTDSPLAAALRDCMTFVTKGGALEAQARFALEWAEREDAEVARIGTEVLAEARAEVEEEMGARVTTEHAARLNVEAHLKQIDGTGPSVFSAHFRAAKRSGIEEAATLARDRAEEYKSGKMGAGSDAVLPEDAMVAFATLLERLAEEMR